MPTTISIPNAECIVEVDSMCDLPDGGTPGDAQGNIAIYAGTPPTNVDTALSSNPLLAELEMSNPAFLAGATVGETGEAAADTITDEASAIATGTATFFRILDRANVAVIQGTVGTSGEVLNLNSVEIQILALVEVTALTIAVPEA